MSISNRIEWIDICKGLCIFLVVIGHTGISKISTFTYDWIYSFHMPLFYMLSGLVFNEVKYDTFNKYIKRRIKTLVFPFLILNFILFCLCKVLNLDNIQPSNHTLLTGVLAMYFLRVLFISEIYYFFINKFCKFNCLKLLAIISLIYVGFLISNKYNLEYIKYIIPGMPFFYYSLGNILKSIIKKYTNNISIANLFLLLLISIIFSVCVIIGVKRNIVIDVLLAFLGIITLMSISLLLSKIPFNKIKDGITYIGMNTLTIVAFHQIIYNGLTIITKKFQFSLMTDSIIRIIVVWIILIFLCRLLNRYFPWVIGKK